MFIVAVLYCAIRVRVQINFFRLVNCTIQTANTVHFKRLNSRIKQTTEKTRTTAANKYSAGLSVVVFILSCFVVKKESEKNGQRAKNRKRMSERVRREAET